MTVTVRRLHGVDELQHARWVCDTVWPSLDAGTEVTQNLITAMEHAGGYVSAAYLDDDFEHPVGAVVSFLGRHRDSAGTWQTHLHSHMAAVLEHARDRNVGTLMKIDQRDWALEQGIDFITWTFDPLVRRNARLNIVKLGAGVTEYLVNFYGDMNDELNTGDESDRFMARWDLRSERVEQALAGNQTRILTPPKGSIVVPLPRDIVAIRSSEPTTAHQWRVTVREEVLQALSSGLQLIGLDPEDSYVFAPEE